MNVKVVKSCDYPKYLIAQVFKALNGNKVQLKEGDIWDGVVIITMTEPSKLTYPEGWYYAKGTLRNKHTSSTGIYEEIPMQRPGGMSWASMAKYSTRD